MRKFAIGLCVFIFGILPFAMGLDARLVSVETDVVVRPDGKADIFYSMEWSASGGEMHGFYFQGAASTPVFNPDRCYADLPNGKRVALDITKMGDGRYDVVLADGLAFSGQAHYFLNYGSDFRSAGLIGLTVSQELGTLFYFDWAPVDWEYASSTGPSESCFRT